MNEKIITQSITSEAVGSGHPDKICDQISDAILDQCLKQDPNSRVACEVFASNRLIVIGGEITTSAYVDIIKTAWSVLKPLGYQENDFTILSNINKQSPDIANKVNIDINTIGAGDQGMVYGYATNETKQYMPLSLIVARELIMTYESKIKNNVLRGFMFDSKSQVTIIPNKDNTGWLIKDIIFSAQHNADKKLTLLRQQITKEVIKPVINKMGLNKDYNLKINHGGNFIIGGPIGDTGLTGRKIIVDTYGGVARHGGGAFSGKDYTKVDRTGAYYARYIAKHLVKTGVCDKCEIAITFCIGLTKPTSLVIDCFNTNKIPTNAIIKAVLKTFDFDIATIVKTLNLKKEKYKNVAKWGHFGRTDITPSWEMFDNEKLALLKKEFNLK